jgi:hypothetical protein
VHKLVLTLEAVPGHDGSRSSETFSRPAAEDNSQRPGSSSLRSCRTAGSSAYPGYLRGGPRSEDLSSSRPTTGEGRMAPIIQLPETPFSAQPLSGDTTTTARAYAGSSLTGQWYAHVRRISDIK